MVMEIDVTRHSAAESIIAEFFNLARSNNMREENALRTRNDAVAA